MLSHIFQFRYYIHLEKEWSFVWTNLNHHYPSMLFVKYGWNCPSGSEEEEDENVKSLETERQADIQKDRQTDIFSISVQYFFYYLPLIRGVTIHLNKLDSLPPKDALCQVCLKLTQWYFRRWWKCEKLTDRQTDRQKDRQTHKHTDRRTDDGKKVIRKAHFSFQLSRSKNVVYILKWNKEPNNIKCSSYNYILPKWIRHSSF